MSWTSGDAMNRCRFLVLFVLLALSAVALNAQPPVTLSPLTQKYIRVNSPRMVLAHVRVIDGTGKPAVDDQNVVIEGGKIVAVQSGADVASSNNVTVLALHVSRGGRHHHAHYRERRDLRRPQPQEDDRLWPGPRSAHRCHRALFGRAESLPLYADAPARQSRRRAPSGELLGRPRRYLV